MTNLRRTLSLLTVFAVLLMAPDLSAQKGKKDADAKGSDPAAADDKQPKGEGRSENENERRRRQREAGTRPIPELPASENLNEKVTAEKARATVLASQLNLRGKTKNRFIDDWVEVIKTNHALLEKAHQRRKVIIAAIALEVQTMTGKKVADFGVAEIQLLNNYYGAASLPPTAYRRITRTAADDGEVARDNPFSLLVKELGKDLDTVKASVEKIRNLMEEENPWNVGGAMATNIRGYQESVKTFLTPEEYFEYLRVTGQDNRPDGEVDVASNRFREALRSMTLTVEQRRAIRRILVNPNLDPDLKRDRINEILKKEQLRRLQEELGEIEKASDTKEGAEKDAEAK